MLDLTDEYARQVAQVVHRLETDRGKNSFAPLVTSKYS